MRIRVLVARIGKRSVETYGWASEHANNGLGSFRQDAARTQGLPTTLVAIGPERSPVERCGDQRTRAICLRRAVSRDL